jgi:SAM-dependent methyltransferase
VIAELLARVALPPGAEILDAGCGSGRNMVDLALLGTVTGVEIADVSVARARERGVGEVVQCSITELPFSDAQFDLAVCFDVVEHVDDHLRALAELYRVVRPGGTLVVTVPAYQWLWSEHDVINHHERRYTAATLRAVAEQAGWHALRTTYFNGCLLPVAVVHRRVTRRSRLVGEPVSDLQATPERLNSLLERPLRFEARVIGMGWRIPAGLSLAAVFSKSA